MNRVKAVKLTQRNSQFGARVLTPDSNKFVATDSENDISFFLRLGLVFFFYQKYVNFINI